MSKSDDFLANKSRLQNAQDKFAQAGRERYEREILSADLAQANSAAEFHKRLVRYVVEFENELDNSKEVGVRLVSFGQTVEFHVENVGYYNPSLISFIGKTEDGNPIQLVQHVSQISFLLMAVPRQNPERPRQEFGYHAVYKQYFEASEES